MSQEEEIREQGQWWLPDFPDHHVTGQLIVKEAKAIRLEVAVQGAHPGFGWEETSYPLIHGRTANGEEVSLIDCFDIASSWSTSSGIRTKRIFANLAFKGFHAVSGRDTNLKRLSACVPLLGEWLGVSGIQVQRSAGDLEEFDIHYKKPPLISFEIDQGVHIEMVIGPSSIPMNGPASKIELHDTCWIAVCASPARPYIELVDVLFSLRDFFSVACQSLFPLGEVHAGIEVDEKVSTDRYQYARILFEPVFEGSEKESRFADFLFKYDVIGTGLGAALKLWIEHSKKLRPVRVLYLSSLYGEHTYLETRFMSMVQAVEVFHRRFRGGCYVEPSLYERDIYPKLLSSLPAEMAEEFRGALAQRMKYLHEYSLIKRLKLLVTEHQGVFAELVPDIDSALQGIVTARNHFTHFASDRAMPESIGATLGKYSEILRVILELSLLREVGLSSDLIQRLARENRGYQRMSKS